MPDVERHAWSMAERAEADVETLSIEELERERTDDGVVVVDIRDVRERWIEGSIPEAKHAPRGMLEFWADPETEYYKEFFDPDNRYVLYCNGGGRSALAAKRLQEMGYEDVAHLDGGFTAWEEANQEVVDVPQKDYKNR